MSVINGMKAGEDKKDLTPDAPVKSDIFLASSNIWKIIIREMETPDSTMLKFNTE